jgi:hypothetical protein
MASFPILSRKPIGAALILAGSSLEITSCFEEILRDGNEPTAGMIALLGLFAIGAGWIGFRSAGEPMTEHRRTRLRLLFEHLAYCPALGAWWLIVERDSFFVDTPFGRSIVPFQRLLIVVFACVAMLSMALRATLRTGRSPEKMRRLWPISASGWQAFAVGFMVLAVLNVVQGQEIVRVGTGLQISIGSRGFPLPAFQTIRVGSTGADRPTQPETRTTTLSLPNGTAVRYAEDTITVVRYPRLPRQLERGVHGVSLSDGTRVHFQDRGITVSLKGRTGITIDPGSRRAEFLGGVTRRIDSRGVVVDLLLGLVMAIHCAACAERIQRVNGGLALTNLHAEKG